MNFLTLPFMQIALLATLLTGGALALIGAFVVTKRISFSGLAISQLAALGAVMGMLAVPHLSFAVALGVVFAGLLFVSKMEKRRSTSSESWVALLYVLGASLVVLVLSKAPHGEAHMVTLFFGNVLSLGWMDVLKSLFIFVLTIIMIAAFGRKWMWISFDPDSSEVSGLKVGLWNLVFYGLFTVAMTFGIRLFGVLLSFSCLIFPAVTSLLLAKRVRVMFVLIPSISGILTFFGFWLAFKFDFPTGPFLAFFFCLPPLVLGAFRKR